MAEAAEKAPPKRRKRRRASASASASRARMWGLILLAVIIVLGVVGTIAFDDRHWHAFDQAGDAAFERGNYDYAARMYNEALQVAQELDDTRLVDNTLQSLREVDAARARAAAARPPARTR